MSPLHVDPSLTRAPQFPFKITVARTPHEIHEAVLHRSLGYGRRDPQLGARLSKPEAEDEQALGRDILMARSRLDGSFQGSLRLHVNFGQAPTVAERYFKLPEKFRSARIMDACRFSFTGGFIAGAALFKATIAYAALHDVDFFVIATIPTLKPLYKSVGFSPVFQEPNPVVIDVGGHVEHEAFYLDMRAPRTQVQTLRPSMVKFLFETDHSGDIDLSGALSPQS